MYKKRIILFSVSVLLLGILFFNLDYEELIRVVLGLDRRMAVALLFVQAAIMLLTAMKWRVVMGRYPVSFVNVFYTSLIGNMVNNLTPASIVAGETVKAYVISRVENIKLEKAFASVFVDLFITVLPVFILNLLAVALAFWYSFDLRIAWALAILGAFNLLLLMSSFSLLLNRKPSLDLFRRVFEALRKVPLMRKYVVGLQSRLDDLFLSFHRGITETMTDTWTLSVGVMLSSMVWVLSILRIYMIFMALGVPISMGKLVIAYTIMIAVGIFPILPGALGMWELIGTGLFTFFGVPLSAAAAVVLIDRVLSYWLPIFAGFAASLHVGLNVMQLVEEPA